MYSSEPKSGFAEEAAEAMTGLRSALAGLISGCRQVAGTRPIDISRGLGIDMKLAWKMSHLAEAARPFDSARHVPGGAGMRIFLDAAGARDADPEDVKRTEAAFAKVQGVIAEHCGSRKVFETMVSEMQETEDRPPALADRERLFEGARSVWGLKADLIHRMDILHPCRVEGLLDCVTIRTLAGTRRLRGGVPLVFPRLQVIDDRGVENRSSLLGPLDEDVRAGDFPIVRSLCDGPIPSFSTQTREEGMLFEAPPLDEADPSSFTVVSGEVLRAAQPTRVLGDSHGIFQLMRFRVPTSIAIFDVLVHQSLAEPGVEPDAYLASELNDSASLIHNVRRVRLPIGIRHREVKMNEVPALDSKGGIGERLEIAMKAAACRREEFRWFRLEAEYPPICSVMAFECEQPSSG
jgi:hypothetical protein